MLEKQLPEGGWAIYPGGPAEISASVKAYFALKLVGCSADDPALVKARKVILDLGGAAACNSFTRFYLALLGQISYDDCPTVPPELRPDPVAAQLQPEPRCRPGRGRSWCRCRSCPHFKPVRRIEPRARHRRAVPERLSPPAFEHRTDLFRWGRFFLAADRVLKWADRWLPVLVAEARARRRAPLDARALRGLRRPGGDLPADDLHDRRPQVPGLRPRLDEHGVGLATARRPCDPTKAIRSGSSPASRRSGIRRSRPSRCRTPTSRPTTRPWSGPSAGCSTRSCARGGDWQVRRPGVEPTGWPFQYAQRLLPRHRRHRHGLAGPFEVARRGGRATAWPARCSAGVDWLLAMQNRDGGWAAFDADIDNEVLTKVPFADHNAMLDPSCADITARVIELLGTLGHQARPPGRRPRARLPLDDAGARGLLVRPLGRQLHLRNLAGPSGAQGHRLPDGPRRRWSRRPTGSNRSSSRAAAGARPAAATTTRRLKGIGEPTASQTAWAVLGLIAAGRASSEAVRSGHPVARRHPA